jgi:hypothetical protein
VSDQLTDLHRIGVKLPLADGAQADLESLIGLFHGWIRDARRPGLLIDVADYRHVHEGPGVMLVGHEGDWSLDLAGGRPGLQYVRKAPLEGDLAARIRSAATLAAEAAVDLPWPVRGDEIEVFANDRLRAPNTEEIRAGLTAAVRQAVGEPLVAASIEAVTGDPRVRVAVRVRGGQAATAAALLQRLNSAP